MIDRLKALLNNKNSMGEQGFTLIELAIVLVIVSLLIGMGLQPMARMLDNAKIKTTRDRMDKIDEAVTVFAVQNSFLPCPADGALPSTNANYGRSQGGGLGAVAGCTAIANGAQVVPWITLGLDEMFSRDGWGNRITYFVAGVNQAGLANGIVFHTGGTTTDGIQRVTTSYPKGTIIVNDLAGNELTNSNAGACPTATGSTTFTCAAYVLVSHGSHASGAYTGGNTPTRISVTDASVGEAANNDGATPFVQNDTTERASTSGIFDDITRWRSAQSIVGSCGTAACGN
ncbi:MAG: prepilin-type N-terminal cleavage/methylation domain-containing protein [Rhodospirillales bacterium]|nr:MAG: prepilin-type N-terminal cleavage/methylation domain-containing protein [Rhodospirillales bacterium]